ncbi:MAG: hypothetical protein O3A46_08820, partial [Candidatus Poribacteria bacterium]|nr:hypothetical protein [Candidatus Poribacteria bacterium]
EPSASGGYARLHPSDDLTVGFAQTSGGASSWSWNAASNAVRPLEPTRLTRGYVDWVNESVLRHAVVGDFSVGSGVGLVLNTGRRKDPEGVRPNDTTVARERGVAVGWAQNDWDGFVFASRMGKRATLPAELTGLERARSVENALRDELLGARTRVSVGDVHVGGTVVAQRYQPQTPFDLEGISADPHIRFGLDADGALDGAEWRGELAHADALGGLASFDASNKRGDLSLNVFSLGSAFDSPHGSARRNRQGIDARGTLRASDRLRVGGRINLERQLSTQITSQNARVWISGAITRKLSGGGSVYWDEDDATLANAAIRRTVQWVRYSERPFDATVRATQRFAPLKPRQDTMTAQVNWSPKRAWNIGVRAIMDGDPSWGNGVEPYALSMYGSVGIGGLRVRVSPARRWLASGARNDVQVTVDYRWKAGR